MNFSPSTRLSLAYLYFCLVIFSSNLIQSVLCFENLFTFAFGESGALLGSQFGLPGTNTTYDYIVVGGGTGGLAIATRLAQDRAVSVAVIEAGGFYEIDNGNLSVVPGYANYYTGADPDNYQPLVDWGFSTVPQAGAADRRIHYARGKTLGGSSARNYLVYQRPTIQSLQKWADEVDDQSYTWDNFLPYFKKSCNYTAYDPAKFTNSTNKEDPSFFENGAGPLHISFSNFVDPFGTWAQKGFSHVGMNVTEGFNGGHLMGSAYATLIIDPRNAHRSSSESSFLQAAMQNGTAPIVYKNTLVDKILFNGTTASGVRVTTAGPFGIPAVNFTLSARKEVIVSAGAFQSPQLLMVSGIGPRSILEDHGISVVKDLPGVGQNMWDHILFGTDYRVNVNTASAAINNASLAALGARLYTQNATGPLSVFGAGYYGWEDLPEPYRSNLTNESIVALQGNFTEDWPELEWLPVSAYLGYQRNRQKSDPKDGYNYATINAGLVSPLSRGNISISSSSMSDPPLINPNWLTDPTDIALAIAGIRRSREIWAYLATEGLTDGVEALPGANVTSDEDILDYIQQSLIQIYHAACTCKMGRSDDDKAVIDPRARVYGVQNLRVVDASSFPFLPPGHPQSVVYALAEKIAADIIAGDGVGGGEEVLNGTNGMGYNMAGLTQDCQVSGSGACAVQAGSVDVPAGDSKPKKNGATSALESGQSVLGAMIAVVVVAAGMSAM